MDEGYREKIDRLLESVSTVLVEQGVPSAIVDFSAAHIIGRRPGEINSQFLTNRAMGDWAERILENALRSYLREWDVCRYGNSDDIVAGDPQFPDFYKRYQEELGTTGKRPDLLIFKKGIVPHRLKGDISGLQAKELLPLARQAVTGIEIRSSKFFALKYQEEREREARDNPGFSGRRTQSFTPKIEDLRLVIRWIRNHGVPHYYFQVFFDSVYGISFERILELIASNSGEFEIERNARNQNKPTIHIPVTSGTLIATFTKIVEFRAEVRETRLHRLDAYVVPSGGELAVDAEAVRALLRLEY